MALQQMGRMCKDACERVSEERGACTCHEALALSHAETKQETDRQFRLQLLVLCCQGLYFGLEVLVFVGCGVMVV